MIDEKLKNQTKEFLDWILDFGEPDNSEPITLENINQILNKLDDYQDPPICEYTKQNLEDLEVIYERCKLVTSVIKDELDKMKVKGN